MPRRLFTLLYPLVRRPAPGREPARVRTRAPRGNGGRAWPGAAAFLAAAAMAAASASVRAQDGPVRILMLGDSLTAGYGLASRDALPARLEAALRALGLDASVINAGVSGDTTGGGLARTEWAPRGRSARGRGGLGANDGLRAIDPR